MRLWSSNFALETILRFVSLRWTRSGELSAIGNKLFCSSVRISRALPSCLRVLVGKSSHCEHESESLSKACDDRSGDQEEAARDEFTVTEGSNAKTLKKYAQCKILVLGE